MLHLVWPYFQSDMINTSFIQDTRWGKTRVCIPEFLSLKAEPLGVDCDFGHVGNCRSWMCDKMENKSVSKDLLRSYSAKNPRQFLTQVDIKSNQKVNLQPLKVAYILYQQVWREQTLTLPESMEVLLIVSSMTPLLLHSVTFLHSVTLLNSPESMEVLLIVSSMTPLLLHSVTFLHSVTGLHSPESMEVLLIVSSMTPLLLHSVTFLHSVTGLHSA